MGSRDLDIRNTKIRSEIIAMMTIKSKQGHQKYTSAYIFDHVAANHELSPRTIKNIFWESGYYCIPTASAQNVGASA